MKEVKLENGLYEVQGNMIEVIDGIAYDIDAAQEISIDFIIEFGYKTLEIY